MPSQIHAEEHDTRADCVTASRGDVDKVLGNALLRLRDRCVAGFIGRAKQRAAHRSFCRSCNPRHQHAGGEQRQGASELSVWQEESGSSYQAEPVKEHPCCHGLKQKAEQVHTGVEEREHTHEIAAPTPGFRRVYFEHVIEQCSADRSEQNNGAQREQQRRFMGRSMRSEFRF